VAVASIGSPSDLLLEAKQLNLEVTVVQYLNILFGRREPEAHKGDFGHILVVGGSVGKAGAAAMAGMAALRCGAGLVTVACPGSVQPTVASFAPELMTEALPETAAGTLTLEALEPIEKLLPRKDVVVLGPGLSRNAETDQFIRQLLPKIAEEAKIVLDADGLNAFAGHSEELHAQGLLILTPHPGEMSRLTGLSISESHTDRIRIARQVAKDHDAIVVLKGHRTFTASPSGQVWVNMTGNPGMAKGGSGDVLSGIIAACHTQRQGGFMMRSSLESYHRMTGLMRRRDDGDSVAERELEEISRNNIFDMFSLFTAAAVCLHGCAGDMARDLYGEASMVATDVIECIGEAISLSRQATQEKFAYLQR
jgi:NAD(P)H-hydrate epimerase